MSALVTPEMAKKFREAWHKADQYNKVLGGEPLSRVEAGLRAVAPLIVAASIAALGGDTPMSDFKTKPNPGQPERCPSIDPHDTLQCARRIHEDDQCVAGGIGWKKGTPRYITDRERVELLGAEVRRLTLELDGARGLIHELRLSLAQANRIQHHSDAVVQNWIQKYDRLAAVVDATKALAEKWNGGWGIQRLAAHDLNAVLVSASSEDSPCDE